MQALTRTYHWLGRDIVALADALCGGRVIFLLEGGYSPRHLGLNVVDSLRGVLDLPSADKYDAALLRDEPGDRVAAAVAEARRIHGL
jgi:acetoin utilization deacetylase AcuC-like enzyme